MRDACARIFAGLAFMFAGAVVLLFYLEWDVPAPERIYGSLRATIQFLFLISIMISQVLGRRESRKSQQEPSAAWSAISVIILTGCAAAFSVWHGFEDEKNIVLPALILVGTALTAIAVFRFARKNAAQIGEARFAQKS